MDHAEQAVAEVSRRRSAVAWLFLGLAVSSTLSWCTSSVAAEWRYGHPATRAETTESPGYPPASSHDNRATDSGAQPSGVERARAYAEQDKPREALTYCLKAAERQPNDVDIARLCAQYAEWAADLPESRRQFKRLLRLAPDDPDGLLGAARAYGWSGKLRDAAGYYRRYLELYPDNQDAWIEYAEVRSWQGNFAAALDLLEQYRNRFGESPRYQEEKARYLAWDDRPRHALDINTPLLKEKPDDYERLYTQAIALAANRRQSEALEAVSRLDQLRPDSEDTLLLDRIVRTPTRSSLSAGAHYSNDSDTIETSGVHINARFWLTSKGSLSVGASHDRLRADIGSGFETIDGRERIQYDEVWIGGSYRFDPLAAVSGRVGRTHIRDGEGLTPYEVVLDLRPSDEAELSLSRSSNLFAPSPRAASLGIQRRRNALSISWRPDYRNVLEGIASYDEFSDGNARTELVLAPRRSVLRTGRFNADLGLYLDWWSFDEDLDNGYYDPQRYQRYAGSFFGYWKLGEDNGLSLVGTAGFDKDNRMSNYELGTDVVLELTWGLYRDWMSVVRVDYSDRYQGAGGYDGWNVNLDVTRRF